MDGAPRRKSEPVVPVDDAVVDATLPFLTPTVRAMVELQRVSGLRPGEVRTMQPRDLVMNGDVWTFQPEQHKSAHMGKKKCIPLGPRAKAILEPFLARRKPEECVFSPAEAKGERAAMKRAARQSSVPPSQFDRKKPASELKKRPGSAYTNHGYASAIVWACARAGVAHWHPNQLRHSFATRVRREFGLEAAQVLLGHAKADVTQVYAERDMAKAVEVARQIG